MVIVVGIKVYGGVDEDNFGGAEAGHHYVPDVPILHEFWHDSYFLMWNRKSILVTLINDSVGNLLELFVEDVLICDGIDPTVGFESTHQLIPGGFRLAVDLVQVLKEVVNLGELHMLLNRIVYALNSTQNDILLLMVPKFVFYYFQVFAFLLGY